MDRVHRLGQTKQVTIYRLITKGTIDERIVNLARQKKDVQDLVVGNKPIGEVAKTQEVLSLLMDDDVSPFLLSFLPPLTYRLIRRLGSRSCL
jgi:DNA helicase INO80